MPINREEFLIGAIDSPKQQLSEEAIFETLSNWRTYIKFTTKLIMEQFDVSYYRALRIMKMLEKQ